MKRAYFEDGNRDVRELESDGETWVPQGATRKLCTVRIQCAAQQCCFQGKSNRSETRM